MDISTLIENKVVLALLSAFGGILTAVLVQQWLNRRSLFTYNVLHNQVGQSADDAIYGSVQVTWNGNQVARLYLSTIELINQSTKDFEGVVVRVFTNNSKLLTQHTQIVGTTRIVDFTENYKHDIAVPDGQEPTEQQFDFYWHQRDYIIPTFNRGQTVRFEFLNTVDGETSPEIWLEVLHKGVNCKFRVAQQQFMGVTQPTAALAGTLVGFLFVVAMLMFLENTVVAAILAYTMGLLVLVPGALAIKGYRKLKEWYAG
ncbi:hypothetical protein [Candidatus Thiodiazotropha sp. LNASS1]|uniref:hypothetical protein n=1 Tax=Candidatus Thiodiazotropha sp. LNASS1 TaxID=3096260 RepID=UPI0034DE4C47